MGVLTGLVVPARGGVERGGLVSFCEMDWTAMEELVEGALPNIPAFRVGPEDRLPGAVTIFAISRPNSPMRPCSSAISSLISTRAPDASPFAP